MDTNRHNIGYSYDDLLYYRNKSCLFQFKYRESIEEGVLIIDNSNFEDIKYCIRMSNNDIIHIEIQELSFIKDKK